MQVDLFLPHLDNCHNRDGWTSPSWKSSLLLAQINKTKHHHNLTDLLLSAIWKTESNVSAPTVIEIISKFAVLFWGWTREFSRRLHRDGKRFPNHCLNFALSSVPSSFSLEKELAGGMLCSKPEAGWSQLCMFGKQMFNFGIGLRPVLLSGGGEKNLRWSHRGSRTCPQIPRIQFIPTERHTESASVSLLMASHPLSQALMEIEGPRREEKIPFSEVEVTKRGKWLTLNVSHHHLSFTKK